MVGGGREVERTWSELTWAGKLQHEHPGARQGSLGDVKSSKLHEIRQNIPENERAACARQ